MLAMTSNRFVILAAVVGSGFASEIYHFGYNHHGEDWMQGECASRDRQSPIDFSQKSAPWDCKPPVIPFLRQLLGPESFIKLGFAKLAGDDVEEEEAVAGAAAAGPAAAFAPAPASASFLEVSQHQWQPMVTGPPPMAFGVTAMPTTPPTPPPMIVPGCGQIGAFFFKYDLAEKPLSIQNNGHAISTDLKGHGLGSITWDGGVFDALSVNFHVHSEHTFKGKALPLELHIVHREPETEHIIVVAIPFDEFPSTPAERSAARKSPAAKAALRGGPSLATDEEENADDVAIAAALSDNQEGKIMPITNDAVKQPLPTDPGFNDALQNLMIFPLPKEGESKPVPLRAGPVDLLSPLIGGDTPTPEGYFQYRGSLTAPPCSEQVTWLVRKTPLYASRTQIELLRMSIMEANSNFQNSRSVMPLMGRSILYRMAIQGDAPPPPPVFFDPAAAPVERQTDFRGIASSKVAMQKALEASAAKDMISTAMAAAQAVRASASAAVSPRVAAATQSQVSAGSEILTTPIPTPDPERVLSRIVDAVATQMDGAEKAAAMAAAGVIASAAPAAAPLR